MKETIRQQAQNTKTKNISIHRHPKSGSEKLAGSPVDRMLNLQRTVGNRGVQRLIKSGKIQAKLTIGKPNDKYEQEADRMADRVMSMPESGVQRKCTGCEEKEKDNIQAKPLAEQITPLVQRQVDEEEEVQPKLMQRQEDNLEIEEEVSAQPKMDTGSTPQVTSGIESSINSMKGGGQPLSESTRSFFEPRFGANFSQVRVHNDSRAANTAQAINAKAFTTGKDIAFNSGQYSPGTLSGKYLLAHELTHVVQQKKSLNPSLSFKLIQTKKTINITRDSEIGRGRNCCRRSQMTCCTFGTASINGQPVGYTLELPNCNNRQYVSRILPGTYRTTEEPNHRLGYCLRLHGVPGRSGVLIHRGWSPASTEGCILPAHRLYPGSCRVNSSWQALRQFRRLINSDRDIVTVIR